MRTIALALAALLALGACDGDDDSQTAALPAPQQPGREAIGYLCNMVVADHQGPHAQLFLEGRDEPLWFSTVRDLFAYRTMAEEDQRVVAAYVSDMGQDDWAPRENGAWLEAEGAVYVIGSSREGGMGGTAIVPFVDRDAAEAFIAEYGGSIVAYTAMPADVIAGTDMLLDHDNMAMDPDGHAPEMDHAGHGADH